MDAYQADYPTDRVPVDSVAELIKLKAEQLRTLAIANAGQLQGLTAEQIIAQAAAAVTANNVPQVASKNGVRTYSALQYPSNDGATSATSLAVCRLQLHGPGFETGSDQASTRARVTSKCLDMVVVTDFILTRNGSTVRIDYQSHLYGGSGELDYYAISRGSFVLPKGIVRGGATSPGYLGWKNTFATSTAPDHDHRGTQFRTGTGTLCAGYRVDGTNVTMIDYIAYGGAHPHAVEVDTPVKINSSALDLNPATNSAVDAHAELGTLSTPKITPVWYADGATKIENHYTQYSCSNFLELRIENIPAKTGWAPMVETTLEMMGCNHKAWFYDSDAAAWEMQPVVGCVGDSLIESVDLRDGIYFNTSDSPYGGQYRFLWTEKRGYYNYGIGGQRTEQILARMQLLNGDVGLKRDSTFVYKSFTHIFVDGGVNDCIQKVLRDNGQMFAGDTYDSSWVFQPLENIKSMIALIQQATVRTITPVVLLAPKINAAVYYSKSGSSLAVTNTDGSSATVMTLAQWQSIAALWDTTATAIRSYCNGAGIKIIDWHTASQLKKWANAAGGISYDGVHPNVRGYNFLADFADFE